MRVVTEVHITIGYRFEGLTEVTCRVGYGRLAELAELVG